MSFQHVKVTWEVSTKNMIVELGINNRLIPPLKKMVSISNRDMLKVIGRI